MRTGREGSWLLFPNQRSVRLTGQSYLVILGATTTFVGESPQRCGRGLRTRPRALTEGLQQPWETPGRVRWPGPETTATARFAGSLPSTQTLAECDNVVDG